MDSKLLEKKNGGKSKLFIIIDSNLNCPVKQKITEQQWSKFTKNNHKTKLFVWEIVMLWSVNESVSALLLHYKKEILKVV